MLGEHWQQIQEDCLHRLGNLTLTGYNSELSDRPFADKKTMKGGFNDSPLRLNSYVRNVDEWNEKTITERAAMLADKAKQIWFAPELGAEGLALYRDKKTVDEYSLDHYERNRSFPDVLAIQ